MFQADLWRNPETMDCNQVTSLSLDTRIPAGMTASVGIVLILAEKLCLIGQKSATIIALNGRAEALVTLNIADFAPASHFRLPVLTQGAFLRRL